MIKDNLLAPKEIVRLENLARKIIETKKKLLLGTDSLTPVNYLEERDKFYSSDSYNPQFIYNKRVLPNILKDIDDHKKELGKLKIPDDLKNYIFDFLDDQVNLYKTKVSIGSPDFSKYAHNLFDWGQDRLDMILTNTPKVKFQMGTMHVLNDAEEIKKKFEKTLLKYKISGFTVKIDRFSTHIISVGYRSVNIGSLIKRFECNVDRLIVHEIESHVLQTHNMKISPTPLSELFKYDNNHLYGEGLAIYNEIVTRKITPEAFETYYFRIKAVRNIHKSFREIYEVLLKNLPPKKAYVTTYRVKRGLSDTSLPGGFPKDASYLLGFHEIENLVAKNYPKKLLFATKSPILSTILNKYNLIDKNKILTPKFE